MPTPDLAAFRGTYTPIVAGQDVAVTFTAEDVWIIFTTTPTCRIKVDVDGSYEGTLIWHTGEITAAADVFTLDYPNDAAGNGHSYYNGVTSTTGENPSVIKLSSPLSYASHTITIEVEAGSDDFNLEAFFVFKDSARVDVRSMTSANVLSPLTMEHDLEELRNEVVVVGSKIGGGTYDLDGEVVNPNNPLFIRTFASAVDLGSIYDRQASTYIGRERPFEIFNDRIIDQDRADHISIEGLKKYRDPTKTPRFGNTGDPRLEPLDPLGLQDLKLNVMPSGNRVWIDDITDDFAVDADGRPTYTNSITTIPREPIPSFEHKPPPDLWNFAGEPIINIELRSQGVRIAGDDATFGAGPPTVVTITTTPSWITNMWDGYYVIDNSGQEFEILSNTGNVLTINLDGKTYADNNWSITFDPFDVDQLGAPLEIHYDQVINARVEIWIRDSQDNNLARVNLDTFHDMQEWGENKVIYWNGTTEFYLKDGQPSGLYVSPFSSLAVAPLNIVFNVFPEDTNINNIEVITNAGGTTAHNGKIEIGGVDATLSDFGTVRIYPKILTGCPLIKLETSGNNNYSQDIFYRGYVTAEADQGGGIWRLTLLPAPAFPVDEYNDYLLINTQTHHAYRIDDTAAGGNDKIDVAGWHALTPDGQVDDVVMIIGQSGVGAWTENLMHDFFKSSDNEFTGLNIVASAVNIYNNQAISPSLSLTTTRDGSPVTSTFANTIISTARLGPWGPISSNFGSEIRCIIGTGVDRLKTKVGSTFARMGGKQHYPDRDLYGIARGFGGTTETITSYRSLLPFPAVATSIDFWVTASLRIFIFHYRASADGYAIDQIDEIDDFYDSQRFVNINDWVLEFNPQNYSFGVDNRILQNSTGRGYYFLWGFRFQDRAGRYVINAWGNVSDNMYTKNNPFYYLTGWEPESGTPKLHRGNHDNAQMSIITQAAIAEELTRWI